MLRKEEEWAKANDTEKESVHIKKSIMVGQFTCSVFLVYSRGERGLSGTDQNIHPPFELISDSVHGSWNYSSTADQFGLKMKELYIEVHDKVCTANELLVRLVLLLVKL